MQKPQNRQQKNGKNGKNGQNGKSGKSQVKNRDFSPSFNQTEENSEIFYGKNAILSILEEKKQINKIFIQKGLGFSKFSRILALVRQQGIVLQEVPKSKLDELTQNQTHQGIVAMMPAFQYQTLEECFALAKARNQAPFFLILDGIEDPHNLGSILRSAEATGVHGVVIPKHRAVGLTGIVAKTSSGAIGRVPVVRVTNIAKTVESLKAQGLWIFAADMNGQDMRKWDSKGPIALVIGNEGHGVSPIVKSVVDGIVSIPMVGETESLNASVAASILMYEVARYRI